VNFENFLTTECAAYCIQKSLLSKLLFDRLNIPSRLVTGSIITHNHINFTAAGHTWVEIVRKDGTKMILDVEHERLAPRGETNEFEKDWFWFAGLSRRENQYFPIFLPEPNR
jgi:hypothetical protein